MIGEATHDASLDESLLLGEAALIGTTGASMRAGRGLHVLVYARATSARADTQPGLVQRERLAETASLLMAHPDVQARPIRANRKPLFISYSAD